jgi:glutathione S-transferase
MTYNLWGTPNSLYTGKARSYLIKQGIAFTNRAAGEAHFLKDVTSKVGRWIIPVLEGSDGLIIQDGADIIRHFEAQGPTRYPAFPATPRHAIIGQIFELFGGEGMLRPAMHYRWNFDDANLAFLEMDFARSLAPTHAPPEVQAGVFAMASGRMRMAMAGFGVTPETIPAIEASYAEFLALFDSHLASSPYLLGGAPTIGDYGLFAPLYAHLARDPYPQRLMQSSAHRVWRWTERMRCADSDAGEYGAPDPVLLANDAVPETLKALLRFVADDYLPEVRAYVAFINDWLAARPNLETGTSGLDRPQIRQLGEIEFVWRGHRVKAWAMHYRLYLLQMVQAVYDAADDVAQTSIADLLAETGLSELITLRTTRRIERRDHLEVWSAPV